jgi:outer membrane protein
MRTVSRVLLTLLVAVMAMGASAQNKFGHIDFGELYSIMPGQDSVMIKYDAYKKTLQKQLNKMQAEYENKVNEFNTNAPITPEPILTSMKEEIADLEERIMNFQQTAQQGLLAKEEELTLPIIEAARTAVEEVAKANGYTYVFNSAEGLLLYAKDSDNIMPLVKKHLGIE